MSRVAAENPRFNRVRCPSRREFIQTALRTATGAALVPAFGPISPETLSALLTTTDVQALTPARLPSRVVRITDQRMIPVRIVQRDLLRDYLVEGLRRLTGAKTAADAWHDILAPDDVILIKFNRSGRQQIGTCPALAIELVDSLVRSGWAPERNHASGGRRLPAQALQNQGTGLPMARIGGGFRQVGEGFLSRGPGSGHGHHQCSVPQDPPSGDHDLLPQEPVARPDPPSSVVPRQRL